MRHPARPPMPAQASPSPSTVATSTPAAQAGLPTPTPSSSPGETLPAFAEKKEVLRNSDVELRLTNRGGAISEVVLLNHIDDQNQRLILNSADRMPIGAIVQKPEAASLPEFTFSRAPDGVQFERATSENVTIRKKFFFPPTTQKKDNFLAQLDVNFRNDGAQPANYPDYYVTLGSARPVHANDLSTYTHLIWCTAGKTKSIDVNWFAPQSSFLGLKRSAGHDFYGERLAGAEWAAVTNQFFATLFAPLDGKVNAVWGRRFELPRGEGLQPFAAVEGAMGMPGLTLQPGQNTTVRFEIYAGPKLYHRLAQLEHNEAEILDFGEFKIICQALLNLMNLLHHYLGNYAAAILALTTIVKLCLWPLQNKANRSMRRMSALSPKMQELREKYKDDPTRMNQEVMRLYKDYGINPVSGCAPMLIQIPIFFGLFTMLRQTVELRNASFLWVHDLSQPDTVGHIPILGWPLNILPLLMALTNVWMMRITPKTGDATQQRVMMFTPIIFIVFCYNFAAALSLYYTTQNLFTIIQLYQNRRQPVPTLEKVTVAQKKLRGGKR